MHQRPPDHLTGSQSSADEPCVRDGQLVYPPGYSNCSADPADDFIADALAAREVADGHAHTMNVVEVSGQIGLMTDRTPSTPHRVLARVHVAPDGSRRVERRDCPDVRRRLRVHMVRSRSSCGRQRRPRARRIVRSGGSRGDPDPGEPAPGDARRSVAPFGAPSVDWRVNHPVAVVVGRRAEGSA